MDAERENSRLLPRRCPRPTASRVDFGTVKGTQFLQPLFEFSGACAGCGETPYLKLLSQLFGDRLLIANATGCSSIYGGNLPTTPWTTERGRPRPGLGELAVRGQRRVRPRLPPRRRQAHASCAPAAAAELRDRRRRRAGRRRSSTRRRSREAGICARSASASTTLQAAARRARRAGRAPTCCSVADDLVRRSVWIVGGDGWAYDIGYGGLDHVLASGRNVNVLVLDTEVYSNTGGQMSEGDAARRGRQVRRRRQDASPKKDLGLLAMAYGNVYVAQVAMGADPQQTLKAFREAEAYDGPSLIIAYSHCIAHGIDMRARARPAEARGRQRATGRCSATTRWCARPARTRSCSTRRGRACRSATTPTASCATARWRTATREAERLLGLAEQAIDQRWDVYEDMATRGAQDCPAEAARRGDGPHDHATWG